MKQPHAAVAFAAGCFVCACTRVHAATVNAPEHWSGADVAGWECYDLVNEIDAGGLSASGGALTVAFRQQSMKTPPEEYLLKAGVAASGGLFAGDYVEAGAAALCFRVLCDHPLAISVLLWSEATGQLWRYRLPAPAPAGTWLPVKVPLSLEDLRAVNAVEDPTAFAAGLAAVSWVGVSAERSSSTAAQSCRVDDFVLTGPGSGMSAWLSGYEVEPAQRLPGADPDGDGMTNWDEWIAGTDPTDAADRLELRIGAASGQDPKAVELRWQSKPNRRYSLWCTESPALGFGVAGGDVEGTGEELKVIRDTAGADRGFFRLDVRMEEP